MTSSQTACVLTSDLELARQLQAAETGEPDAQQNDQPGADTGGDAAFARALQAQCDAEDAAAMNSLAATAAVTATAGSAQARQPRLPKRRGSPQPQPTDSAAASSADDGGAGWGVGRPRSKRRRGAAAKAMAKAAGAQLTGHRVLQGLTRKRVRDDGSCWVYALLAGVGLCDHTITSAAYARLKQAMIPDPSARDRAIDQTVRELLFSKHGVAFGFDEAVLRAPNYEMFGAEADPTDAEVAANFFGSYGGMRREFPALATEFAVEIALWDETAPDKLKDAAALWQLACVDGLVRELTAAQIVERARAPGAAPLVHVAWSDQIAEHFECYVDAKVGKAFVAPEWLRPFF